MLKNKKNKLIFLLIFGSCFFLISNNIISEVKGSQITIDKNYAIFDQVYCFMGDQISISVNVISGSGIDVYLLDTYPQVLFTSIIGNILLEKINIISGTIDYTAPKMNHYYIVFVNDSSSGINLEYSIKYYPIGMVITIAIISIVISSIIGSIVILLVLRRKKYVNQNKGLNVYQKMSPQELERYRAKASKGLERSRKMASKELDKHLETTLKELENAEDVNWKKQKKKQEELNKILNNDFPW